VLLSQRGLTNVRVQFADGPGDAKYVFPFWDQEWTVRRVLLDMMGGRPLVLPAPVDAATEETLRTSSTKGAARTLADTRPEEYAGLHHFDVAWVLRGMLGPSESLRHAVLRTNLAGKAKAGTEKVHDVEFDERLEHLTWVVTQDRTFLTRRYGREKLAFRDLR